LFFFVGASIWEGSAAVSAGGELPERGYYAATNSFPRNTIVDITNLETGKTVRVIVAAALETPGLLAVLSRDAAGEIGLPSRSVGRIRMIQPTDPIAFSRFTEGLGSSGDPDYDPQALIRSYAAPVPSESSVPPAGSRSDGAVSPEPESAWIFQEPGSSGSSPVDTPPAYPPEDRGSAVTILEEPKNSLLPQTPVQQYPYADGGAYDLALVPSESRPPAESYHGLPPEAEIPPLPNRVSPPSAAERTPDPAYIIPPAGAASAPPPVRETTPFPPAPPVPSPGASSSAAGSAFSVPLITSLEKGKYYLQLGAYSKAQSVESEIGRIGKTYPLAVQNGGTAERPIYRILLGPVNLGESGALLERFKMMGYADAFVRSGGM
jgi:hypothetical protein